jgi:pseudouridine synthase
MAEIRIHVHLARLGLGSRREIESWIVEGKVSINGKRAQLGAKVNPDEDSIKVKGKLIARGVSSEIKVVALHKPRGVVTTMKDPEGRPTVIQLIPKYLGRLYPVGRLDLMSEGLVLMTNDGVLAERLMHPRYEVPKVYDVKIRGNFDESKMKHLERGMRIDNTKYQPAEILDVRDVTREGIQKFKVTIKVYEGKNHHVRNLFDAIHCRVIRLKRISIGPVRVKGIARGGHKILSNQQIRLLKKEVGL